MFESRSRHHNLGTKLAPLFFTRSYFVIPHHHFDHHYFRDAEGEIAIGGRGMGKKQRNFAMALATLTDQVTTEVNFQFTASDIRPDLADEVQEVFARLGG